MPSRPPMFAEREFRMATRSNPNRDGVAVARRDGWAEIRDDEVVFGARRRSPSGTVQARVRGHSS